MIFNVSDFPPIFFLLFVPSSLFCFHSLSILRFLFSSFLPLVNLISFCLLPFPSHFPYSPSPAKWVRNRKLRLVRPKTFKQRFIPNVSGDGRSTARLKTSITHDITKRRIQKSSTFLETRMQNIQDSIEESRQRIAYLFIYELPSYYLHHSRNLPCKLSNSQQRATSTNTIVLDARSSKVRQAVGLKR